MSKYISIVMEECVNIPTTFQHFFKTTTTDDYVAVYVHTFLLVCSLVYDYAI